MARKRAPKPVTNQSQKEKMTTSIEAELLAKAKATAWHLRLPLSHLVEDGLRREISRLERKHQTEFKDSEMVALSVGRPLKR